MKQKVFKESHIPFNQFTPMMTSYEAMAEYQNQETDRYIAVNYKLNSIFTNF